MDFKDYLRLDTKDANFYVIEPFEFHTPKKCVVNIHTEPVVMLFGKIYSPKDAFDVTQCISTKTKFSSYIEEEDRYRLIYEKGDIFASNNMIESISNQEIINNLFLQGQILEDMEYQNVYRAYMNASRENMELDVPLYYYEYMIAILLADRKDKSKQARFNDINHFASLSIKQINTRAETFVALTTNDLDTMIISSLNEKKDALESPDKKVFLM